MDWPCSLTILTILAAFGYANLKDTQKRKEIISKGIDAIKKEYQGRLYQTREHLTSDDPEWEKHRSTLEMEQSIYNKIISDLSDLKYCL